MSLLDLHSCVTGSENYSYSMCDYVGEDRRPLVWHLGIAFLVIGVVAFVLRCLARLRTHSWGLDDWTIFIVVLIYIPMSALTFPLSSHGLGLDMWTLSPDDINHVLYYFYWEEILYAEGLAIGKISILLFYLRVFPQQNFRYMVFVMIALNAMYAVGFGLAVVLQCTPVDGAWRSWDGEYKARCFNVNYLGWSGAGANIFFDFTTLILPLPVLAQLTMGWRKKLQVLSMFAVGFLVTLVSILRLKSMIQFGSTTNVTRSAGVRNKKVLKRYSKFGNSTEITLDTSMNQANWSDVELVAMEKSPSPQTDVELLTPPAASPHSSKRWSALSDNLRDSFGFFQSKPGSSSRSGTDQG
ncbi:separin protein [Pestalotiopsis sp. IQ-011]